MAISPEDRSSLQPLRGTSEALNANILDIKENEICYATDTDQLYIKTGGSLVAVGAHTGEYLDDRYINSAGDSMLGGLTMEDADIFIDNGDLEFEVKGDTAFVQNTDNRFGKIVSRSPKDTETNSSDFSAAFGVKIDLSEGNSYRNNFAVGNQHGDIVKITGGTGSQIEFATTGFTPNESNTGLTSGIAIRHIPTPDFDNSPGDLAVNKEYVDARDEILQQEIIELEEEIEAIAPSFERGTWLFNPTASAGIGQFGLQAIGTPTSEFPQADALFINSVDSNGGTHSFTDITVDSYVEVFDSSDDDYGLYQIRAIHDETSGATSFWHFELEHIRSNRLLAGPASTAACRFKFFELSEGADATTFVLKTGDQVSGQLKFENTQEVVSHTSTHASARVVFENRTSGGATKTTHLFQPGNLNALIVTGHFKAKQDLYTTGYLRGWNGDSNAAYSPNVRLTTNGGTLNYGSNSALYWGDTGVSITKLRGDSVNGGGFTVQGAIGSTYYSNTVTDQAGALLQAYHKRDVPDEVNYHGRISSNKNIATKEYVDAKAGLYVITKSNGNYYVS